MKHILILMAAVGLFLTTADAWGNAFFADATTNPNESRFRSFSGADGTGEADDDFTFEIDILWPDLATTPWDNRLILWVDLCSTSTAGPSGSTLGNTDGIYVTISPPTSNALGNPLTMDIQQIPSAGGGFQGFAETVLTSGTVAFSHTWHRLRIELDGTTITATLDDTRSIAATANAPRNTGEFFHVMQRMFNTTDAGVNIRFDNIRVDGVTIENFESFANNDQLTPANAPWLTTNGGNLWRVDGNVNSNYITPVPPGPNSVEDWILH